MSGKLVNLSSSGSFALGLTTGEVNPSSSSASGSAWMEGSGGASSVADSVFGAVAVSSESVSASGIDSASAVSLEVKADGRLMKEDRLLVNEELEVNGLLPLLLRCRSSRSAVDKNNADHFQRQPIVAGRGALAGPHACLHTPTVHDRAGRERGGARGGLAAR